MEHSLQFPIAGILCVVLFSTLWTAAVVIYGHWTLGTNTLSDLGVCGNEDAELCFNGGCALAGLLATIFAQGLIEKRGVWLICGITTAIAGIMLIGVGIINLRYDDIHLIDAGMLGVFAAASMALSIYGDWKGGHKRMVLLTVILLVSCAIVTFTQRFAVFEPFGVIVILIWVFVQSVKLLKEVKEAKQAVNGTAEN